MPALSRQQLTVLVLLTLVWGLNWPVLKLGVQGFPPFTFRAVSLLLGLPLLGLAVRTQKLPLGLPRALWGQVLWLGLFNAVLWHALIISAVPMLSSGRAAILGYTMPIFSALLGALFFHDRLPARGWAGVAAAAAGVLLLLWNEMASMGGRPLGVALMLAAAAAWALGTRLLRRSRLDVPTLTLTFWMMAEATVAVCVLGLLFERDQWRLPGAGVTWAIVYNAALAIGFAQTAWFYLARSLPPLASTLSVMMIPVLGVFSGALWLGEQLHWQDWTAVVLMTAAIASVLWPTAPVRPAA
ncbi:DMT family transporter [Ottowia sp.]|uniref:DMT family transporter n=1 Tax=Ottowia sp. TaxID=1898956 RepID=UPI0039E42567